MAHKPHLLGRLLKGAAKVLLTGTAAAIGLGAIGGIAKGTGALIGVGKIFKKFAGVGRKVKQTAVKIVTGENSQERDMILAERAKVKEDQHKLDMVQKLVNEGMDPNEARAKMGLAPEDLPFIPDKTVGDDSGEGKASDKKTITEHLKSPVILAGLGLLVLLFFMRKKR